MSSPFCEKRHSGDMYRYVPSVPYTVSSVSDTRVATLKSAIFMMPSLSSKMLSGLRSRWITPFECTA